METLLARCLLPSYQSIGVGYNGNVGRTVFSFINPITHNKVILMWAYTLTVESLEKQDVLLDLLLTSITVMGFREEHGEIEVWEYDSRLGLKHILEINEPDMKLEMIKQIFPLSYQDLLGKHKPEGKLLFGLAGFNYLK